MPSNSSLIVCLIGIDGTGKTVHSLQIMQHLQSKGFKCKYSWFGAPFVLSYPFMVFCRLLGLTRTHNLANGMQYAEHQYVKNKPIALLWPWIQFFDLAILVSLRVRLSTLFGYSMVCDRFVHDAIVGLMDDIGDADLLAKTVGNAILRLQPLSSQVFLLDVDARKAFERKSDIPNMEYILRRKIAFKKVASSLNIPIIDANEPFESVHEHLVSLIRI